MDTPRFLQNFDETLAGDLVLPRGMLDRSATSSRKPGAASTSPTTAKPERDDLIFTATVDPEQQTHWTP